MGGGGSARVFRNEWERTLQKYGGWTGAYRGMDGLILLLLLLCPILLYGVAIPYYYSPSTSVIDFFSTHIFRFFGVYDFLHFFWSLP